MLPDSGRRQAQRLYRAHSCVQCGRRAKTRRIERHHIDGDTANNDRGNIKILCSTCHAAKHLRLPLALCAVCRTMFQPKRRRRSTLCGNPECHRFWGQLSALKRWYK